MNCRSQGYSDLGHVLTSLCVTGVWRRKAIVTVGGWKSRTTVEDMDLSLRTYVNGWKAIYLKDVTCINEVRGCQHAVAYATARAHAESVLHA